MTDAAFDAHATIGDNAPPDPLEILRGNLEEANRDLLERTRDLLDSCGRMPEAIEDDEMAGKFADQIKLLNAAKKTAEKRRVDAKEPHLVAGRAVDAFFKNDLVMPLADAAVKAGGSLTIYERQKADEARRAREAEERRAREEAERQAREAEAAAQAAESETDLEAAIAAEAAAKLAEQAAQDAAKAAEASNAELSRNRGEHGAVASLRTTWVGEVTDARAIDLETLRPFFSLDVLQKAVNAYVRQGGREMQGARIFEQSHSVVR